MRPGHRSGHNPAPDAPRLREAVSELLVSLQSKLDALNGGSEEARRVAHELQAVIEEVRQALEGSSQG